MVNNETSYLNFLQQQKRNNREEILKLTTGGNGYPIKTYQIVPDNSADDEVWVSDEIPTPYDQAKHGSLDNYRKTIGQEFLDKKCKLSSCEEFFKSQNCSFTSSLKVTEAVLKKIWSDSKFPKKIIPDIENLLLDKKTSNKFVVCDMEKCMKGLGKGLFLSPSADPIQPGMPILLYAGQLLMPVIYDKTNNKITVINKGDYCYSLDYYEEIDDFQNVCFDGISNSCWLIDAHKEGGIARFVQHAPEAHPKTRQILDIEDKDDIGSKVLTANVLQRFTVHDGIPIRYFQTIERIYPGDELRVSYGLPYWKEQKHPFCVFNSNHEVIGQVVYENNKYILHKSEGYDSKKDKNARRNKIANLENYLFHPFKAENHGKIRERLQTHFEHVLKVAIELYPDNTQAIETYIQEVKEIINLKTASETKCGKLKCIADKFTDEKIFIQNRLLDVLEKYENNCLSQPISSFTELNKRSKEAKELFDKKNYSKAKEVYNGCFEMLNKRLIDEEYTSNDDLEAKITFSSISSNIANCLLEEKNYEEAKQRFSAVIKERQSLIEEAKTNPKLREILNERKKCTLEDWMEKAQKKFEECSSHLTHEESYTLKI